MTNHPFGQPSSPHRDPNRPPSSTDDSGNVLAAVLTLVTIVGVAVLIGRVVR